MNGYWPVENSESTLFQSLLEAIRAYDEGYVVQMINLHPELLSHKSQSGETLHTFIQKTQTSTAIKGFVDTRITENNSTQSKLK